MLFERTDWTLFRSLDTLGQRAGVTRDRLGAVVVKELVDNALDAGANVKFGHIDGNRSSFWVEDDGPGLPGTDQEIAELFSISRPLRSSKLLRLPTRGALGNGLRVVVGAVLATGGTLHVETKGRKLLLKPQFHTGKTLFERVAEWQPEQLHKGSEGSPADVAAAVAKAFRTRIEVVLGEGLKVDFSLAELAKQMAGDKTYKGLTSPWWYSSAAFRELVSAAPPKAKAADLLAKFDGGRAVAAQAKTVAKWRIEELHDSNVTGLFDLLRGAANPIKPAKLGFIGKEAGPHEAYGRNVGFYQHGDASLPCVVEVWADRTESYGDVRILVNRTPVVSQMRHRISKDGTKAKGVLSGCGLNHWVETGKHAFDMVINVQTPYMAVTNDGKEPDLKPIYDIIAPAVEKSCRIARRLNPATREARLRGEKPVSKKDAIAAALDGAVAKASGNGKYRYSLRQLYYAIRPVVGTDLDYGYFGGVIADIETARGEDLPGIYRDARGQLYHPHTGETIALGTRAVEEYSRPAFTFNKILYIEKGGFFPLLIENKWPEKHDCALVTSQGYASKAAKDVLDLLGDTDEEIEFYVIHDADGPGTGIFESLQEATRARPARRVKLINLGLEPSEGRRMGLEIEEFERKKGKVPCAGYVSESDREWLQSHRIELNAMTSPQFLRWLTEKFERHSTVAKKVIPDSWTIQKEAEDRARRALRARIVADILSRANVDELVAGEMSILQPHLRNIDVDSVTADLEGPASWRDVVGDLVKQQMGE